jgi:hypothetical protein
MKPSKVFVKALCAAYIVKQIISFKNQTNQPRLPCSKEPAIF